MKRRTFLTAVATAGVAGWAIFRRRSTLVDMFTDRVLIDPLELGPRRTTPPPCRDVLQVLPELASQARDTTRLHPRRLLPGRSLPREASKLGGEFLWPAGEPWPTCDVHHIPWVGVLQLRAEDVPGFRFKPGADLFQLLWCPQDHGDSYVPEPVVFWRRRRDISDPLTKVPQPRFPTQAELDQELVEFDKLNQLTWLRLFEESPDYMKQQLKNDHGLFGLGGTLPEEILNAPIETEEEWQQVCARAKELATDVEASIIPRDYAERLYVPNESMLFPEVVREYPEYEDLTDKQRSRLATWDIGDIGSRSIPYANGIDLYDCELSVADGTKLGGRVNWVQSPEQFTCDHGHPMEHLLTIASWEFDVGNWLRWAPLEEQNFFAQRTAIDTAGTGAHAIHEAAGLVIGDAGNLYVFVCRECEDWPIRHTMQCS